MKLLKEIEYRGYDIKIYGKYDYDSWNREDCVKVVAEIWYVDNLIIKDTETAYEVKKDKFLFWTLEEAKTLKESTEELLVEQKDWAKRYVDDIIHKNEMTDGLMDSLDTLNK